MILFCFLKKEIVLCKTRHFTSTWAIIRYHWEIDCFNVHLGESYSSSFLNVSCSACRESWSAWIQGNFGIFIGWVRFSNKCKFVWLKGSQQSRVSKNWFGPGSSMLTSVASIHTQNCWGKLITVFFLFVFCLVMNENLISRMILRMQRCMKYKWWLLSSTMTLLLQQCLAESQTATWMTVCMTDTRKCLGAMAAYIG